MRYKCNKLNLNFWSQPRKEWSKKKGESIYIDYISPTGHSSSEGENHSNIKNKV